MDGVGVETDWLPNGNIKKGIQMQWREMVYVPLVVIVVVEGSLHVLQSRPVIDSGVAVCSVPGSIAVSKRSIDENRN